MRISNVDEKVMVTELEAVEHCCDADQKDKTGSPKRVMHKAVKPKGDDSRDGVGGTNGSKSTSVVSSKSKKSVRSVWSTVGLERSLLTHAVAVCMGHIMRRVPIPYSRIDVQCRKVDEIDDERSKVDQEHRIVITTNGQTGFWQS